MRVAGVSVEKVREELRDQLVHAMRWGHTLVIRMANTAADFLHTYCHDESFPRLLFEHDQLPSGAVLPNGQHPVFSKVLRPQEITTSGGQFGVPSTFRIVVSSTFKPDAHASLLGESLPLEHLQPIHIVQRGSSSGPVAGGKLLLKGQTKEGQLTGDRTTLILQAAPENRGGTLGERQANPMPSSQHSYSGAEGGGVA